MIRKSMFIYFLLVLPVMPFGFCFRNTFIWFLTFSTCTGGGLCISWFEIYFICNSLKRILVFLSLYDWGCKQIVTRVSCRLRFFIWNSSGLFEFVCDYLNYLGVCVWVCVFLTARVEIFSFYRESFAFNWWHEHHKTSGVFVCFLQVCEKWREFAILPNDVKD